MLGRAGGAQNLSCGGECIGGSGLPQITWRQQSWDFIAGADGSCSTGRLFCSTWASPFGHFVLIQWLLLVRIRLFYEHLTNCINSCWDESASDPSGVHRLLMKPADISMVECGGTITVA